jgi:hypothetical protein
MLLGLTWILSVEDFLKAYDLRTVGGSGTDLFD